MNKHKVIEPHKETPASQRHLMWQSATQMPEALISEQVQRVQLLALIGAGLWTYGLVMDGLIRPNTVITTVPATNIVIELIAIAVAGLMWLYLRWAPHSPQTKSDAGLGFFVLNALFVALLNNWDQPPLTYTVGPLSWNAIVVLICAMIMPSTPRKMFVTSMVAATMDPLTVWVAHLRGVDVPSAVNTFVLFMPNYACAVVAWLPSRVLQHLGRRLRQAQEMGSYHLEEMLGRGGMGEVWRARHQLLARTAAIKLVRPELLGASNVAEAQSMLRRFEREAQATAALSSPHSIRLFDFGVTADRTFYYVMELLSGRDLETLVHEFGPVPAERTIFLLKQVLHSLADAHARGLIHRDVTPSNIYVCRMGLDYDFVKVLDFGLVRFRNMSDMEQTLLTGVHTTTGTPAFMAPEIILEGEIDQRADVYALGCVAYYLLTGQMVFEADTPMKMFVQHLQATPVPPSQRTELPVPRDLDQLVLACLEKDPARRPRDASELLRRLEQLRIREEWDNERAQNWWEMHLAELTGPLAVAEVRRSTVTPRHRTAKFRTDATTVSRGF